MKKIISSLLASLFLLSAAQANEFTFSQAGVKLNAPNGFTLLSRPDIELFFRKSQGPSFMIGNATRGATISYDLKPHDISAMSLTAGLKTFEVKLQEPKK